MKNATIERSLFLANYRHENVWAVPILCAGMLLVAWLLVVIEFSNGGLAAMASLLALFSVGILKSARTVNQSDGEVLRLAAQRAWGMYLWLGVTVIGLGLATGMNMAAMLVIIGFTVHTDGARVKQARSLMAAETENVSLVCA